MYCVGLTGTIASGKSVAIHYFNHQGIPTLNADVIARNLAVKGSPILSQISDHFGSAYLLVDGELNRSALRQRIIHDAADRKWLENLLHPLIRARIEASISKLSGPYCVIEIPLLLNRAPYPYLNRVLLITAEPELQMARLMARDQCSESEAQALLDHQHKNDNRADIADDVIVNTGSLEEFYRQLEVMHQKYLTNAD